MSRARASGASLLLLLLLRLVTSIDRSASSNAGSRINACRGRITNSLFYLPIAAVHSTGWAKNGTKFIYANNLMKY